VTSSLWPTSERQLGDRSGGDGPRVISRRAAQRRRRRRRALLGAVVVLAGVTALSVELASRTSPAPVVSACAAGPGGGNAQAPGATYRLDPDQAQNAAVITAVAQRMGLADHAVTIALATAMQESRLSNLPYGDLDSVGLFQQRPSEGWGTRAELLDPQYAAAAFYRQLTQIPGWQTLPVTVAAQDVQRSAAPTAYAPWEPMARSLAAALTGETSAGFTCRLAGFAGAMPAPGALASAAATEMGGPLIGMPVDTKTGWRVASWAVAHSWQYHVNRVSFDGWTWTPGAGKWVRASSQTAAATGTVQVG
jgi:hypothetical protein